MAEYVTIRFKSEWRRAFARRSMSREYFNQLLRAAARAADDAIGRELSKFKMSSSMRSR